MSDKENLNVSINMDLGGEYPNRASEIKRDENEKAIQPISSDMDLNDPRMAPVYAGPSMDYSRLMFTDPRLGPVPSVPTPMMMVYAGPDAMSGRKPMKPQTIKEYPNPKICPVCEAHNREDAKFCENCGSLLEG